MQSVLLVKAGAHCHQQRVSLNQQRRCGLCDHHFLAGCCFQHDFMVDPHRHMRFLSQSHLNIEDMVLMVDLDITSASLRACAL